ncbi:MAG: tryptophan synthase subunit alpha [Candidatus Altiarchaeales archaeon ex4484_96]|nr:MAG: tryptophan synthase subunit alpha [Candidatus Altiarchaeales archaeon ex4484_96]
MRLKDKFSELEKKKEKALIGFFTAGDPNPSSTIKIAEALIEGGVDILELGLPFSDPIADGPLIQKSSERSLRAGMNPDVYFELAKGIKADIPLVCLTYYNLVLQRGLDSFVRDCVSSNISSLIVPDLPVEESTPLHEACLRHELDLIYLVAPTTTDKRLKAISERARGFIYLVSSLGVTGVRESVSASVKPNISRIRAVSGDIPLAVGFGISRPAHVREVADAGADGIIVGSAFVRLIEEHSDNINQLTDKVRDLCMDLKKQTKGR